MKYKMGEIVATRRDSRPSIEGCQLNVNKEVTAKNGGNEWEIHSTEEENSLGESQIVLSRSSRTIAKLTT